MYVDFYHLVEKPFELGPDLRYLYLSAHHREALAHLTYGVKERKNFVQLTGEVGMGKTTMLDALVDGLDVTTKVARLSYTTIGERDLLLELSRELGVEPPGDSKIEIRRGIEEFLDGWTREGRNTVFIIDESQNLKLEVLEEVRLLSNLRSMGLAGLQIVLAGQPELRDKLELRELRQLRQRIGIRYHLVPLSRAETAEYIAHRLTVAGASDVRLFDGAALDAIFRYSEGVPRVINIVCDAALLAGYAENRRRVGKKLILESIESIEGRRIPERPTQDDERADEHRAVARMVSRVNGGGRKERARFADARAERPPDPGGPVVDAIAAPPAGADVGTPPEPSRAAELPPAERAPDDVLSWSRAEPRRRRLTIPVGGLIVAVLAAAGYLYFDQDVRPAALLSSWAERDNARIAEQPSGLGRAHANAETGVLGAIQEAGVSAHERSASGDAGERNGEAAQVPAGEERPTNGGRTGAEPASPSEAGSGPASGDPDGSELGDPAPANVGAGSAGSRVASPERAGAASPAPEGTREDRRPVRPPAPAQTERSDDGAKAWIDSGPVVGPGGAYAVIARSVNTEAGARAEAARLEEKSFGVEIAEADLDEKGIWYRVIIRGGFPTFEAAQEIRAMLGSSGYGGAWIIKR